MRILSFLLLSVITLTAAAQNYKVTGTADASLNGKYLYLIDQTNMEAVVLSVSRIQPMASVFSCCVRRPAVPRPILW